MQNIVLITRDNGERVTGVSVFLCNRVEEAAFFCRFTNRLSLAEGENIFARRVIMGKEYILEKRKPFAFDDIVTIDYRHLQRMMREMDTLTLKLALARSSEEVKDKFFRNMSRRAAAMLQEDMEFMGWVDEADAAAAKEEILDIYFSVNAMHEQDQVFGETVAEHAKKNADKEEKKESVVHRECIDYDNENVHAVLVFGGAGDIADRVAVMLFNAPEGADNFCAFINTLKTLKPAPGAFIYARRAEQMSECEITRPLLAEFSRILDCPDYIVSRALAKVGVDTIVDAVKGLDAHSLEKIIGNLPEYMEKKALEEIERHRQASKSDKSACRGMKDVRHARQKIVNAIIAVERKIKNDKDRPSVVLSLCG